ncbi:porin [Aromatoleum toluclasticum]|uniref:porin n=1 Tax=Aromatoleum toluclasticum TaxID=92003 RepID=UPI0003671A17|nr:porin [Aromatoleum toluclasticum]MCC4116334.1 porin [Aromatoleum toluclasticum]
MQKKLIALAIAGLASAPVFAQTNVTVYGVVDVTLENVRAKGGDAEDLKNRNRVTSNSSLLGFRGAEDLGNGLKALFQVESGFAADGSSSTSGLATRDTFVGLTGGFGTLQLGKLTTIMRTAGAKVDFNPAATGIGFQAATYGTIGGIKTGVDERINNSVMYTTPSFSGFNAQLAYTAGENRKSSAQNLDGKSINAQGYQLAGAYENGPLYVSAGYALQKDLQLATAAALAADVPAADLADTIGGYSDKLKTARIAAKYTFPSNTTVSALWDRSKYEVSAVDGKADVKRNAWLVGAEQKFAGNQAAYLQYSRSRDLKGDVCDVVECNRTGFSQWTLGYTYALSKRTMVKAYYTRLNNERDSGADFYLSSISSTGLLGDGQDATGFGLGLRHTF